ncbi:MAG: hypothetical protein AB8B89_01440 [Gammaproteobacteria bacterium]
MQVNPNIQYNEQDAGLTLDDPIVEPVEKAENTNPQVESSNAQDEADLIKVEEDQKVVAVNRLQSIALLKQFVQARKDDSLFVASCMAAGVISVIVIYFLIVFM